MANNEVKLKLSVDGAKAVLSDFDKVRSKMSGVSDAATTMGSMLKGMAAAFSVTAVTAWVRSVNNGVDALNDLKDATGASISNLSALEDIARRTGGTLDTVSTTLVKFNQILNTAKAGSGAELAIKAIGLSVVELKALDPAEALRQTAVALSGFADDGGKARIILELFGKTVKEVAPFLNDLAEKTALVGTVTAEEALEAEKLNKEFFNMSKNVTDLSRQMVGPLVSAFNKLIEKQRELKKEGKFGLFTTMQDMADRETRYQDGRYTGSWGNAVGNAGRGSVNPALVKPALADLPDTAALAAAARDAAKALAAQDKATAELLKTQIEAAKWNTKAVDELFDAQEKVRLQTEDKIKTARTTLEQIEFETALLSMNTEQRALATMERELEREGIVKGTLAYDAYIVKLREAMAIKTGKEAGIKAADDMREAQQKAAEESAKYWEDALMRAFESGKGFFQSLWDTIKNTLKTQILKVTVQGVMGTLGIGATGAAFAGGAGGSDILGLANTASSLSSLYSAGSSIITIGSQVAAGTMGIANALGTLAANATGTGISGLLAANGAFGTAAAGTASAAAGSLTAGLAAIPGWGWAALGVAAVASIFGGGGETRSGATYDNVGGVARYQQGPSGGEIAGAEARRLFNVATDSITAALAAVGSKAKLTGFTAGLESSGNGKGFDFAGGFIDGVGFGEYSGREGDKNGQFPLKSQSAEQAFANYATQLKQATVQALQAATDVPQTIKDMLSGINANSLTGEAVDALLGNINAVVGMVNGFNQAVLALPFANLKNLSFDAAAGLLAVTGGLDALGANLASYYDTYYSESERLAMTSTNVTQALAKVNVAIPATKDAYRDLVDSLDLTTVAGRNTYAVMLSLAPQFAQVADAAEAAATETVKLMNDVFDTLQDRLTGLIDSIASERAAVASASASVLGLQPKTAAQLAAEIAASKVALPSDAGVLAANATLTAAKATLANVTILANRQSEASNNLASSIAIQGIDQRYYIAKAAESQAILVKYGAATGVDAYTFNPVTNRATFNSAGYNPSNGYTQAQTIAEERGNAGDWQAWFNYLQYGAARPATNADSPWTALDGANTQMALNEKIIAEKQITLNQATSALNGATVAGATSTVAAADAAAKQALLAYADAMTQYSGDAEKAVKVLSQLREETVAYYEAQKELAGLMSTSAANLRAAVRNSQFGQLASTAALAQQQRDFAANYSLALATGGATKAGYADSLTAALPALTSALMDTSSTRSAWALATAKLYTQSETIAAQLDSAAAGMNYEAESLSLLGSIDVALGELDTNTAILKNAIDGGTATSAAGLRAIVTQLGGVPAFASGGSFAGGLRMVGENGPELEVTGPSRIFNAAQTRSLLQSGGAGGQELVNEMRALRAEVQGLRAEARATASNTNKTAKILGRVTQDGESITTTVLA